MAGCAVSIASLGASVGGMIGAPLLLSGTAGIGFAATTVIAGVVAAMTVVIGGRVRPVFRS